MVLMMVCIMDGLDEDLQRYTTSDVCYGACMSHRSMMTLSPT